MISRCHSRAVSVDEPLYVMPLQFEVAFLHISRVKQEFDRGKIVIGFNGAVYAPLVVQRSAG
jgi:hypothetical protein